MVCLLLVAGMIGDAGVHQDAEAFVLEDLGELQDLGGEGRPAPGNGPVAAPRLQTAGAAQLRQFTQFQERR
jgi:hypothetical protein